MQAHEQRVVEERKELDEKIEKLDAFTGTSTFTALAEEDSMLLLEQRIIMHRYREVLGKRIARFAN